MENWQLALIIIAAIFTGIMIPMILQYHATLRSVHRLIRDNESDIRRTVIEMSHLAGHYNRVGAQLEANTKHMKSFFEGIEEMTEGVRRIRGAVRTASVVGAAVAPAITAAIRMLQPTEGEGSALAGAEMVSETVQETAEGQPRKNGVA